MATGRTVQVLSHQQLSGSFAGATQYNGTLNAVLFKSALIPISVEAGWMLSVRVEAAPTGTTPSITWEVGLIDNGASYARVGAAGTALTTINAQLIPFYTNATRGLLIPAYDATHTYFAQVRATLFAADNVFPSVSADLIEL